MPLLNFIVLLKINSPLIKIYNEVKDAWGSNIDPKTFRVWRRLYQEGLQNANVALGLLVVGGSCRDLTWNSMHK